MSIIILLNSLAGFTMQEVIHKAEIGFSMKLSTTPAEILQEQ